MSIRYIFCDVDFTLTTKRTLISERNLKAINDAREKGIAFVLCSGRTPGGLAYIADQLRFNEYDNEYIIYSNGAIIINSENRILFENYIEKETARKMFDLFWKRNARRIVICTYDSYYMVPNGNNDDFPAGYSIEVSYDKALDILENEKIYKFIVPFNSTEEIDEVGEEIREATDDKVSYFNAILNEVDFMAISTSKMDAVRRIADMTGTDLRDTLSIGDNMNDKDMLMLTGFSACPDNAVPQIKEICDYVSPYSCDEDAVADIIYRFIEEG